jgi:TolB-like protein
LTDIFLSYNREDQARAKLFADAFAAAGLTVWWDTALRSGEAYDEVTEAALRAARAVVVLWSPRSVVSRWVRAEATIADRCKTFVPVTIAPCERPIMFELTQTAELSHWTGDTADRAWLGLLNDVQRFVGKYRAALAPMPSLASVAGKSEPTRETLIAVLPFDNLSSDSEMDFFCDGFSEDIMGRIIRASKLQVVGRASSFQFRGTEKSKAAAALAASHVLDGSIRLAGNRVRITAQLTVAQTNRTIWADKYDRDLSDIFAVQDEISEAIAAALDIAFFPAASSKIDTVAYALFLRGREVQYGADALSHSVELLQAAVQIAPDFADAWGVLAYKQALVSLEMPWLERGPVEAKAESSARRALDLDPDNIWAVMAQARVVAPFGEFLELERIVQRLEQIGQYSPEALGVLGYCREFVGQVREARDISRRAVLLDPLNDTACSFAAQALWRSGDLETGVAALQSMVDRRPDNHHNAVALILAYAQLGNWAAVDRLTDPARLALYPLREHYRVILLLPIKRDPESDLARQMLAAMPALSEQSGHVECIGLIWMAELGLIELSFAMAERSRLDPAGNAADTLGANAYRTHGLFEASVTRMRADPRFVKLCARLGLVEYWLATQKWPDCADTVPYDFRAECEEYRDFPKDVFLA